MKFSGALGVYGLTFSSKLTRCTANVATRIRNVGGNNGNVSGKNANVACHICNTGCYIANAGYCIGNMSQFIPTGDSVEVNNLSDRFPNPNLLSSCNKIPKLLAAIASKNPKLLLFCHKIPKLLAAIAPPSLLC